MLYLLFQIGDVRYALDTATVLEIVPRVALRPVLHAPRGVAGLLDYHEAPVPVLDLCEMATGQPAQTRFSTRLILVQTPNGASQPRVAGLLAERATTLLKREPGDFRSIDMPATEAPYLGPVTADGEGFIHRIDVEGLLSGDVRALLACPERPLLR